MGRCMRASWISPDRCKVRFDQTGVFPCLPDPMSATGASSRSRPLRELGRVKSPSPIEKIQLCFTLLFKEGRALAWAVKTLGLQRVCLAQVFIPEGFQPLAVGRAKRHLRKAVRNARPTPAGSQHITKSGCDPVGVEIVLWFRSGGALLRSDHRLIAAILSGSSLWNKTRRPRLHVNTNVLTAQP